MMAVIGLVGFAGSGKGTVADYLVTKHNYTKMAFADPLKDAVSVIFGWPRLMLEGDNEPSRLFRERADPFWTEKFGDTFTPRIALQKLGTESGRNVFHQDIWVYALEKRIKEHQNVVVADVRFPNEIEAIIKWGGHILRVKRGPEPVWYDTAYKENRSHPDFHWILYDRYETMDRLYKNVHVSEWAWIGNDHVRDIIHNNTSISDLENQVEKYLTSISNSVTI
jgi:hypothetical protein